MDEIIGSLIKLIEELNQLQLTQLKIAKEIVEFVTHNHIVDERMIEKVFDELVGLTYWFGDDMESIYFMLLDYYKNINRKNANDYKKFYLEVINEEKVKIKKLNNFIEE